MLAIAFNLVVLVLKNLASKCLQRTGITGVRKILCGFKKYLLTLKAFVISRVFF